MLVQVRICRLTSPVVKQCLGSSKVMLSFESITHAGSPCINSCVLMLAGEDGGLVISVLPLGPGVIVSESFC